ncbi:MAG: MurR/RpiR family transcriptional regulator [Pseudomonadota bacterium]
MRPKEVIMRVADGRSGGGVPLGSRRPTTEAILDRLTERFEDLPPQLQRAARFIIDNPRAVGVQSMRALAGKAEVHPNTLVRLAREIGFSGYDDMRARFRDFLVSDGMGGFRNRAAWLQALEAKGGTAAVIAEMATATGENVESTWRRQDAAELTRVADRILGAQRVFVLGMGSAYSLAHQFWYVARMGFEHIQPIPRHGSHPVDDLSHVGPQDVLIALTFQPYRSETMQAVRFATERGAHVIGITDSLTSPLARAAGTALVAPTHTPQFFESHTAVLALLEGVVAVLVARGGAEAAQRIARFHQQRLEAGLYEEPDGLAGIG